MRAAKEMWIENVLKNEITVYAHYLQGKEPETIEAHTGLCLAYYERLLNEKCLTECVDALSEICVEDDSRIMKDALQIMLEGVIGLHDTGKINPAFQRKCMEHSYENIKDLQCVHDTDHSLLSAYIYLDYFCAYVEKLSGPDKLQKRKLRAMVFINAYIISRHHGDLAQIDKFLEQCNEGGELYWIADYFKNSEQPFYQGPFCFKECTTDKIVTSWKNFKKGGTRKKHIALYFYCRFVYSLLVTCDYYATTEYMTGYKTRYFGENRQKEELIQLYENSKLTQMIREYGKTADYEGGTTCQSVRYSDSLKSLNGLRSELFLEAEKVWQKNKNARLFFLEAPTGSGKSNTALNLSFQMLQDGAERLYYIYPFNTLVEQNKMSLEKIFGQDESVFSRIAVVNSLTPIKNMDSNKYQENEDRSLYYQKALLDRQFLNYPLVISTHVTLFQTMFGAGRTSLFGFLQLAHSVIVLDEIQSYRNEIWSEIICFLQVLAEVMDCRVIIMSATLPNLEYLTGQTGQVVRLIENREKYFYNPLFQNRVELSYELLGQKISKEQLFLHIFGHVEEKQNVLVEFIKKESAYNFYQYLCENTETSMKIRLLTGDDNQVDREKILKEIKDNQGAGIILVSTQVIEAGVDIDMDIGYKDISKLDSEEQFLGRINRSYKDPQVRGMVYFFDMDSANMIYRNDIRISRELTLEDEYMREILKNKNFDAYYEPVMQALKQKKNEQTTSEGLEYFFDNQVAAGDFPAVQKRMQLIEEDQWHMSVYLSRVIELPDGQRLDGDICWSEYKELLQNQTMDYAEKQVKLSAARSKINYFIYQIKQNSNLVYNDFLGELIKIDNGEEFFENGKLNRKKLEEAGGMFIDF